LELCGPGVIRYKVRMGFGGSMKRMRVTFSGRVQGVGFRYTVCRIAKSFQVTGFVQNRADGDVELVAEGTEQELVDFLNRIRSCDLGSRVTQEKLHWDAASGAYEQFGISY
jgi:acylphosphatase